MILSRKVETYKGTEILISEVRFLIGTMKMTKWVYCFNNKDVEEKNDGLIAEERVCFNAAKRRIDLIRYTGNFKKSKLTQKQMENDMGLPKRGQKKEIDKDVVGGADVKKRRTLKKRTESGDKPEPKAAAAVEETAVVEKVVKKESPKKEVVKKESPKREVVKTRSLGQIKKASAALEVNILKATDALEELEESFQNSRTRTTNAAHSLIALGNIVLANQEVSLEDGKTYLSEIKSGRKAYETLKAKLEDAKAKLSELRLQVPELKAERERAIKILQEED